MLIAEKEKARLEEKRRLAERSRREAEERAKQEQVIRLYQLQKTITESIQSQYPLYCRLRTVETGSWDNPSSTSSLIVSDNSDDLLRWNINGQPHKLKRLHRYVCLLEASGKFGWARVGQTRITFFDRGVTKGDSILLGNVRYQLQFHAVWLSAEVGSTSNLLIAVRPANSYSSSTAIVHVHVWFSLDSVELMRISSVGTENLGRGLVEWIGNNREEFKYKMLESFLDSYTYESLSGVQAGAFLQGYKWAYYYRVRLHVIAGRPLLVVSTLN